MKWLPIPLQVPLCRAIALALAGLSLASCIGRPPEPSQPATELASPIIMATSTIATTVEKTSQPSSGGLDQRYRFPAEIDTTQRYLFYLHGKIIEDQGIPAISPEYGEYQYEQILSALKNYGFQVVSEQRPRNADSWEYARKASRQVAELLSAGVPPGSITVIGASKGAAIATLVSYLVGNADVNYVLLGSCHSSLIEEWRQAGVTLSGNVLAISDSADEEYSGSCEQLFALSEGKGLNRRDELVLHVGTGHGILYEPLPEWVLPTVRWANQEW